MVLDDVVDPGELTRATGLLFVRVGILDPRADGFTVGYLRLSDLDLDAVGALEDIHLDIEVQLTHALDDGLAAVPVGLDMERRILLDHLAQRGAHLLGTRLVLGRDGDGDDRIREHHRLQGRRPFRVTEGVPGLNVLHPDDGDNIARLGRADLLARVGVKLHQAADALGLAGGGIQHIVALRERA